MEEASERAALFSQSFDETAVDLLARLLELFGVQQQNHCGESWRSDSCSRAVKCSPLTG